MSIPILNQVYTEMRRLAIAGSVVARGDFRLKQLVAPLEQAGAKAPVFARVAAAVREVVEGPEQTSAQALLELTSLVNAILYTQGETGVAGALEPIETTNLGVPSLQSSARVLKPLLEALSTTGSGRLEVIKDAYERGAFRDLRLVKPALDAIDDGYGEIGDIIAAKVLPLYGKAILPQLRASFDVNGKGGHPRRLKLMHDLDPVGTRDLVKQALDSGSKEVKIVAIACLGGERDDLVYLLEQAKAKAQEVRHAAYAALATGDDGAALAVLRQAMIGKDLDLAEEALARSRNPKLLAALIETAESELAGLRKTKVKKEISEKIDRLMTLMNCLSGRDDKETTAFLAKVFAQRDELVKIKGDSASGSDLNTTLARIMANGSTVLRTMLVEAHGTLSVDDLSWAFLAARYTLPAETVFAIFSPYLTAREEKKKKSGGAAGAKQGAILGVLCQNPYYYHHGWSSDDKAPPLDPRWLDRAVEMKNLDLVCHLIRPGHAAAHAFLTETLGGMLKKVKHVHEYHQIVSCMIRGEHPEATDAVVALLEKFGKKANYLGYWFGSLIVDLPRSALPRLEALLPALDEKIVDSLLGYIQQLREKNP